MKIELVVVQYLIRLMFFCFQGVTDALCEACEQLKWKSATKIQKEAIPLALQGKSFQYLDN